MWCFRLILWGAVFAIAMIPGVFLARIVGRVAGFRPGPKVSDTEKVFGWVGAALLGALVLSICMIGGLIDWAVTNVADNMPILPPIPPDHGFHPPPIVPPPAIQQLPNPKPIPADWDERTMARTFLSDMQEFAASVGWGTFGKRGKLGYEVFGIGDVKVNAVHYPNAISMHPPIHGHSTVKYRLKRDGKLFIAHAALGDLEGGFSPHTPATFGVLGDHQLLWVSPPLQKTGVALPCRISVEGVEVLELQIHCPGHNAHVRGVWLDPHVMR